MFSEVTVNSSFIVCDVIAPLGPRMTDALSTIVQWSAPTWLVVVRSSERWGTVKMSPVSAHCDFTKIWLKPRKMFLWWQYKHSKWWKTAHNQPFRDNCLLPIRHRDILNQIFRSNLHSWNQYPPHHQREIYTQRGEREDRAIVSDRKGWNQDRDQREGAPKPCCSLQFPPVPSPSRQLPKPRSTSK